MPVAESPRPAAAFDPLYTTTVRVTGDAAREASSDDGRLRLGLSAPDALGVAGAGTNPGQLFAASYAACFHGILVLLGRDAGADMRDAAVRVTASYLHRPRDGSDTLAADLEVELPHVPRALADALLGDAERACPYARMARHGVRRIVTAAAPVQA